MRDHALLNDNAIMKKPLTVEEFEAWQSAVEMHGEAALKATALQRYIPP